MLRGVDSVELYVLVVTLLDKPERLASEKLSPSFLMFSINDVLICSA